MGPLQGPPVRPNGHSGHASRHPDSPSLVALEYGVHGPFPSFGSVSRRSQRRPPPVPVLPLYRPIRPR